MEESHLRIHLIGFIFIDVEKTSVEFFNVFEFTTQFRQIQKLYSKKEIMIL